MTTTDYRAVLMNAFARFGEIVDQRAKLELERAKLHQFIAATVNMLPDDDEQEFTDAFDRLLEKTEERTHSLTEAIRKALQGANQDWLTVAQVRDRLAASGFDFSGYTSNPLASISTTLKRFKSDEVESRMIGGVTVYRWKATNVLSTSLDTLLGKPREK